MSGLDTSQIITDEASQHADEMHVHSRPHPDISGQSPLAEHDDKSTTAAPSAETAPDAGEQPTD